MIVPAHNEHEIHGGQDDFGDSNDDDDEASVYYVYSEERRRCWGQGKDLCIIKQAPKDAAVLSCLSCAI